MADAGTDMGSRLSEVSTDQPIAMAETIQAPRQQPGLGPGPRTSLRQASRGTFKRMLAQRQQEEQEYAEFERAAEARMRHGNRPAHPAQPQVVPAASAAATGCSVDADGVVVVVKKRRGRPPKPRPPEPPKPHLMGAHLEGVLASVRAAADSNRLAPGTPVWVKVTGYCAWPGLVWSLDLCARFTWPDVILTYVKGKVLVRFYGDHSSSWVADKQLLAWDDADVPHKSAALTAWGKRNNKLKLVNATLDELSARSDDPDEEMSRMDRLGRQYQLDYLQATARHRHSSLLRPHNSETGSVPGAEGEALGAEGGDGTPSPVVSVAAASAAAAAAAAAAGGDELPVTGNAWGSCDVCREEVPDMRCSSCHRWLHALCSSPAALTPTDYPHDQDWSCPCCGANNTVKVLPEEELLRQAAGQGVVAERMGLTPDWIISTTAFMVFQLPRPTADQPYIAGLLDPACNNKLEPNIPAEVLYDKRDDGLDPANSWKGYYVLLNPDYRAQVQWKFVNRAIDEVENGNVPAVLLVCRNSTDTAYFQRLRPYPRVLLRRCNTQFKDYDKCPIGFGVVVFCIATAAHHDCLQLYERFYKGFSPFGEPNIPIDTEFLSSPSFYQLLSRLRLHAEQHARDHWVQCSKCGVWRIISWQQQQALNSGATAEWTCNMLRPPLTSCATPQSKREITGMAAALDGPQHTPATAPAAGAGAGAEAAAAAPATPAGPSRHSTAAQAGGSSGRFGADEDLLLLPQDEEAVIEPAAGDTCNSEGVSPGAGNSTPAPADAPKCSPKGSARGSNTPPAEAEALAVDAAGVDAPTAAAAQGPAGLLALFKSQVAQLHTDLAAAYLCKAAAGQVTIQRAREALDSSCGDLRAWGPAATAATPVAADAGALGKASYFQRLAAVFDQQQQQQQQPEAVVAAEQQQQRQQLSEPLQVDLAHASDLVPGVNVQGLRQQLLQTAAGRPVKRQRLSCAPTVHVATGTGSCTTHSMTVPDAGDLSCKLALNSLSPGLSVLAPVVLNLVRDWLLHLVQQLLLQQEQRTAHQQARAQAHNEQLTGVLEGGQVQDLQGQQPAAAVAVIGQGGRHLSQENSALKGGTNDDSADMVGCPKLAAGPSNCQPNCVRKIMQADDQQLLQQQQQQQVVAEEQVQRGQQVPLPTQLQVGPAGPQEPALHQQQQQQQPEDSKGTAVGFDNRCQLHADVELVPPPTAVLDRDAAAASAVSSQCNAPSLPAAAHAAAGDAAFALPRTGLVDPQLKGQDASAASAATTGLTRASASAALPPQHAASQWSCPSQPQSGTQVHSELQAPLSPITPVRPLSMALQGAPGAPGAAAVGLGMPVLQLPWGTPAPQLGTVCGHVTGVIRAAAAVATAGSAPAGLGLMGPMAGAVLAGGSVGANGVQGMRFPRGALLASPQRQQQQLMVMQLQLLARCRTQGMNMALGMQPTGLQFSGAAAGTMHHAATGGVFQAAAADAALVAAVTVPQPAAAVAAAAARAAAQGGFERAHLTGGQVPSGIKVGASAPAAPAAAAAGGVPQKTDESQNAQADEGSTQQHSASPSSNGRLKPAAPLSTEQQLICVPTSTQQHVGPVTSSDHCTMVAAAACAAQGPSTPPAGISVGAQGQSTVTTQLVLGRGGSPPVCTSGSASGLGEDAADASGVELSAVEVSVSANHDDGATTAGALRTSSKGRQPSNTAVQASLQAAAAALTPATAGADGGARCSSDSTAIQSAEPVSAVGLRPRAVWALTADPLLRAVLLEQPCVMEAVLTVLQDISKHLHTAHADMQQVEHPGSSNDTGASQERALQDAVAAGGSGKIPASGTLPLCAEVDMNTLEALCSQPAVTGVGKWPARPLAQPQHQQEVADHDDGCEVDEYEGVEVVPDSTAEEVEMMSSLELARAARMAANKAYMLGLGLGQPSSLMQQPSPAALEPNHAAVIAAARKLAQQAAVRRAKQQVDASQRLLDARRKARRQQEKRLRATLEALCADEAAAAKQVTDALRTLQDVQHEAFGE